MAPVDDEITVITIEGKPVEFTWRGRRYRVHSILSRWKEAGGWWRRPPREEEGTLLPDDQTQEIWRVEAAPEGALGLFHLRIDEKSGRWRIER
jgi:hypothetical protein